MSDFNPLSVRQRYAIWLLRAEGLLDLSAAAVVGLSAETIHQVNQFLGLAPIPAHPLMWYLIRAAAGLYAAYGAMLIYLSLDVRRYRPAIRFLGGLAVVHGAALVVIDRSAGLPLWWCAVEGPTFAAVGIALLCLLQRERGR